VAQEELLAQPAQPVLTEQPELQQPLGQQLDYSLVEEVEGEAVLFQVWLQVEAEVVELSAQEQLHQEQQPEQPEHQHLSLHRLEDVVHQGQLLS
jgi:hypothetical protein